MVSSVLEPSIAHMLVTSPPQAENFDICDLFSLRKCDFLKGNRAGVKVREFSENDPDPFQRTFQFERTPRIQSPRVLREGSSLRERPGSAGNPNPGI